MGREKKQYLHNNDVQSQDGEIDGDVNHCCKNVVPKHWNGRFDVFPVKNVLTRWLRRNRSRNGRDVVLARRKRLKRRVGRSEILQFSPPLFQVSGGDGGDW